MKLTIAAIVIALFLTSCASTVNTLQRNVTGITGDHYLVTMYSGGNIIRQWELQGTVNEEDGSDGWYFSCDGLIRISGDVVVEVFNTDNALDSRVQCNE